MGSQNLFIAQLYNSTDFFSFRLGARVVIFLDQGRQSLAQHRRENPDLLFADLPSRSSLEKAADGSKFEMAEFVDESSLYLAVLLFQG